ncbi:MAG: phosphoribosylformylglycinamidine synthase I [Candidatus Neomarinimicrobiota bacterium]
MSEIKIGVIQFPGSNTERETGMALERAGLEALEFLWNQNVNNLKNCAGYIITGGFSYEDRSRAGVLASLDPLMDFIKQEAALGKPVLGICNGAQILVEAGLVPGLENYAIGVALTDNKRIINGHVIGTGYFNAWANLVSGVTPQRTAFTRHLKIGDRLYMPLAHAEGRFIVPKDLLKQLINNEQTVFRYGDETGNIRSEFPVNPNGSDYNLAAISNPGGNVLALMPHPERCPGGDPIFTSMKEYIKLGSRTLKQSLNYKRQHFLTPDYKRPENTIEWIVGLIITDNEAISVETALARLGIKVKIKRYGHWEFSTSAKDAGELESEIKKSGELFNSNKEYVTSLKPGENTTAYLVRPKDDMTGQQKKETLTGRFNIKELNELKKGVVWKITVKSSNFEEKISEILTTHILFNPISHDCFKIF